MVSVTRLPPRDQRDVLKIGELADDLKITPRTIRLYEELGLIMPERTPAGTRLYRRKDAKRLAVALRLAHLGMKLEDVQRLTRVRPECESGKEVVSRVIPMLEEVRAWIDAHLADFERLKGDLERAEVLLVQCSDCSKRPNRRDCPECPVDRHIDTSDLARLIWDPKCP